jgi:hypothetical protein
MLGGNRQPVCRVHQERQRRGSYRHWQEQPGRSQRLAPDQPQAPHPDEPTHRSATRHPAGGDYLSADHGSHGRRLMLYSNHPAGMTFGASRTVIFGYVTERCDLIVIGGGASGGTLAHTEIDKRPKRLTFLSRPREVRYR